MERNYATQMEAARRGIVTPELETVARNIRIAMETGKVAAFSMFCFDFDRYECGGERTYASGMRLIQAGLDSWKECPLP